MTKFRVVSLLVVAALIAAACGGGGDDESADDATPTPTEEPTPEPTEEPTPEPTPEATPEPTEEPTPEPTPEPEPLWWDLLDVGSCFDDPLDYDYAAQIIEPVDCAQLHDNEIFHTARYPAGSDPYPGEDALFTFADESACVDTYEEFTGFSLDAQPIPFFSIVPTEETWAAGDRQITCAVYEVEDLIGSVASAGLEAPELVVLYVARVDDLVDLYLALPGQEPINITTSEKEEDDIPPSVSEASLVVFGRFFDEEGTDTDIWSVDLLTGEQTTILDGIADEAIPRIRNDGSRIVYISDEDTDEYDIWSMNPDGSDRVRLTDNPDRDSNPNWSPDGSQIVYRARIDGNSDIWIMNADGSDPQRLTDDPGGDYDPVFSPDGTKIAFTSDRTGDFEIWVMDIDGSNQTNLTNHPSDDEHPTWTSDSNGIGFTSTRWSTSQWLMRADGSEQTLFLPLPRAGYGVFSGPLP